MEVLATIKQRQYLYRSQGLYDTDNPSEVGELLQRWTEKSSETHRIIRILRTLEIKSLRPVIPPIKTSKENLSQIRGHFVTDQMLRELAELFDNPAEKLPLLRAAREQDKQQFRQKLFSTIHNAQDSYIFLNALCLYRADANIHDVLQYIYDTKKMTSLGATMRQNFIRNGRLARVVSGFSVDQHTAGWIAEVLELDKVPELYALFQQKIAAHAATANTPYDRADTLRIRQFVSMFEYGCEQAGIPIRTMSNLGKGEWLTLDQFSEFTKKFKEASDALPEGRRWVDREYRHALDKKHPANGKPFLAALKELYIHANEAYERLAATQGEEKQKT